MRLFILYLSIFLFLCCSNKVGIKSDLGAVNCECANSSQFDYASTENYLRNSEIDFGVLVNAWNYLNEPNLGAFSSREYRLTVIFPFSEGYSIRIVDLDSITHTHIRLPDKKYIQFNKHHSDSTKWREFNNELESLFWKKDSIFTQPEPILDGAAYIFEGLIDGKYKLIVRGSDQTNDQHSLLYKFKSFMPEVLYKNCKKSKMACV